jgi:hypothetical protein
MFRTAPPAAEPAPVSPGRSEDKSDLVPLSHLELDHPRPSEGWADFLGRRAIAFVPDDLGRDCIRRQDARRLLDERRADELRAAKLRQLAEQEAVEADQLRRASIWKGAPAVEGVRAAEAMLQAAHDARPKRQSVLQHALGNSGELEFHPLRDEGDAS